MRTVARVGNADDGEIVAVATNPTLSTECAWHAPVDDTLEECR